MKLSAIFLGIAAFLFVPSQAFAEVNVSVSGNEGSSQVNVESNSSGTSTVCQNGHCTTTGGENSSTVCINGTCTTTSGDVNYQSDDGNTKVNINNNSDINVQVNPTDVPDTVTPTEPEPTITIDPEIEKKVEEVKKEVAVVEERIKQRSKEQESILAALIKTEMENLQKFLNNLFS